jgi:DnaJ-class molecular chaperone
MIRTDEFYDDEIDDGPDSPSHSDQTCICADCAGTGSIYEGGPACAACGGDGEVAIIEDDEELEE